MPEEDRRAGPPTPPSSTQPVKLQRVPAYLISLLILFAAPVLLLWKHIMRSVQAGPFYASVAVISIIGWGWSIMVRSHLWWEFPEHFLAGWRVVPYLPIEEFLFYPFGGILSIFLYAWVDARRPCKPSPRLYWTFLVVGTVTFSTLALWKRANGPYYLYSQLLIFNLIALMLAPRVAGAINLKALSAPIAALGVTGFCWDYVAFKYDWWIYNAITQIKITLVPIDDFNFFFFAPTAAVSIYLLLHRMMRHRMDP